MKESDDRTEGNFKTSRIVSEWERFGRIISKDATSRMTKNNATVAF